MFVLLVVVGVSCLTNGKDKISSETVSDTENSQMQQTAVETTEAPMSSDNSSTVQESLQSVDKWTQAFAARDVRTIQDMATDDAKNELKEENLLDDNGNFGWSSPGHGSMKNQGCQRTRLPNLMIPLPQFCIMHRYLIHM